MHLTNTRPNICFAVNALSQYMVDQRQVHLVAAKHVLRYLKGTIDYGLRYAGDCKFRLLGYTDSNWAGSFIDWKSTSGCCFSLGSAVIAWRSRKQTSVAISTTKAKYIVACETSGEAIWLWRMLSGVFDRWRLLVFIVIIKVASSSLRIWCFTINPSILRSNISTFTTWWRRELWSFSTLLRMSRSRTYWPSLCQGWKLEYFRDKLHVVPRKREWWWRDSFWWQGA